MLNDFLKDIQQSTMPVLLTDSADVGAARELLASGFIEAIITAPNDSLQQADIQSITDLGMIAIRIGEAPNEQ